MPLKFARAKGERKDDALPNAFHSAVVSETARTTGLLRTDEQRAWAMARAAQLADCERRRSAAVLTLPERRVTADERLLERWEALQTAIHEAA